MIIPTPSTRVFPPRKKNPLSLAFALGSRVTSEMVTAIERLRGELGVRRGDEVGRHRIKEFYSWEGTWRSSVQPLTKGEDTESQRG